MGEQPCLAVDEFLALRSRFVTSDVDVDVGTITDDQMRFDGVSRAVRCQAPTGALSSGHD